MKDGSVYKGEFSKGEIIG